MPRPSDSFLQLDNATPRNSYLYRNHPLPPLPVPTSARSRNHPHRDTMPDAPIDTPTFEHEEEVRTTTNEQDEEEYELDEEFDLSSFPSVSISIDSLRSTLREFAENHKNANSDAERKRFGQAMFANVTKTILRGVEEGDDPLLHLGVGQSAGRDRQGSIDSLINMNLLGVDVSNREREAARASSQVDPQEARSVLDDEDTPGSGMRTPRNFNDWVEIQRNSQGFTKEEADRLSKAIEEANHERRPSQLLTPITNGSGSMPSMSPKAKPKEPSASSSRRSSKGKQPAPISTSRRASATAGPAPAQGTSQRRSSGSRKASRAPSPIRDANYVSQPSPLRKSFRAFESSPSDDASPPGVAPNEAMIGPQPEPSTPHAQRATSPHLSRPVSPFQPRPTSPFRPNAHVIPTIPAPLSPQTSFTRPNIMPNPSPHRATSPSPANPLVSVWTSGHSQAQAALSPRFDKPLPAITSEPVPSTATPTAPVNDYERIAVDPPSPALPIEQLPKPKPKPKTSRKATNSTMMSAVKPVTVTRVDAPWLDSARVPPPRNAPVPARSQSARPVQTAPRTPNGLVRPVSVAPPSAFTRSASVIPPPPPALSISLSAPAIGQSRPASAASTASVRHRHTREAAGPPSSNSALQLEVRTVGSQQSLLRSTLSARSSASQLGVRSVVSDRDARPGSAASSARPPSSVMRTAVHRRSAIEEDDEEWPIELPEYTPSPQPVEPLHIPRNRASFTPARNIITPRTSSTEHILDMMDDIQRLCERLLRRGDELEPEELVSICKQVLHAIPVLESARMDAQEEERDHDRSSREAQLLASVRGWLDLLKRKPELSPSKRERLMNRVIKVSVWLLVVHLQSLRKSMIRYRHSHHRDFIDEYHSAAESNLHRRLELNTREREYLLASYQSRTSVPRNAAPITRAAVPSADAVVRRPQADEFRVGYMQQREQYTEERRQHKHELRAKKMKIGEMKEREEEVMVRIERLERLLNAMNRNDPALTLSSASVSVVSEY